MKLACKDCGHVGEATVHPDVRHPNFPDLHCGACDQYLFSVLSMVG